MTKHPDDLLQDVHKKLVLPAGANTGYFVSGKYSYYHYNCDQVNDCGWGCGYRSLQTVCSWIYYQKVEQCTDKIKPEQFNVPSICNIQDALVNIGDKPSKFVGSKEWIGSFEVCLCADYFFDVPCKIHHIRTGENLAEHASLVKQHFTSFGSPVMMGGDQDAASKCVIGICETSASEIFFLVLDPHCTNAQGSESLIANEWLAWRSINTFDKASFYNLCLPQLKSYLI